MDKRAIPVIVGVDQHTQFPGSNMPLDPVSLMKKSCSSACGTWDGSPSECSSRISDRDTGESVVSSTGSGEISRPTVARCQPARAVRFGQCRERGAVRGICRNGDPI